MWIGVPFTDIGLNPLDPLTNLLASNRHLGGRGTAYSIGRQVVRYSRKKLVNTKTMGRVYVSHYRNPNVSKTHPVADFSGPAVKYELEITPSGRRGMSDKEKRLASQKDIQNANIEYARRLGYPEPELYAGRDWKKGFGEEMTWHHDTKRGVMQLVSRMAHRESLPHIGGAELWYR